MPHGWAPGPAKTLTRFHDPVVVSTAELASVPDHSTASFRLYRVEKEQLLPIPLQFDARDDRGDVVVDGAAEFSFDDNDELVFMAKDTGDRALGDHWPAGCDAVVEIAVVDPRHGERGWACLLHFSGIPPPPAPEHYVSFDRIANQARSSFYQVDYARARNFYTGLRVAYAASGNDTNLILQMRMRGSPTLSLLFSDFTFEFTEQSSIVAIDGVRVGPVRAVRRVRLSIDLGPLFPDLPSGTRSAERVETDTDHDWWVHSGAAGTILHAFVIPEQWRQWGIARGTVLKNGRGGTDGDGPLSEQPAYEAGYSLLHMTNLREARAYDLLQADVVLPRPYRPGDETESMEMLRAPLRTEVRRLR